MTAPILLPPQPEPVEYQICLQGGRWTHCAKHIYESGKSCGATVRALYEHPPTQPQGLTDADIDRIADAVPVDQIGVHITTWHRRFARAVLAAQPAPAESVRTAQVAGLTQGMEAVQRDAARYRWLAPRLIAADFAWGEPPRPVLIFEWDENLCIGADCGPEIDVAMRLADDAALKGGA